MKFKSYEARWYGIHFYILFVFTIVTIVIPGLLVLYSNVDFEILPDNYILLSIIFVPIVIYFGYRYIYFSRLNPTNQQILTLEKIETTLFYRAKYSLMMEFNGLKRRVYTLPIFSTSFIGVNKINYINSKKVLVGYDEKRDKAIVIKVIEE